MLHFLSGLDLKAIASCLIVLGGFVGTAWAGIRAGLKTVRGEATKPEGAKLIGGTIMDSTSMLMLSERLRENSDVVRENTAGQRETAHQLERLRDKL